MKQCFKASNIQVKTPQIAYHMQKVSQAGIQAFESCNIENSLLPFPDLVISAVIFGTWAGRLWQGAGTTDGGRHHISLPAMREAAGPTHTSSDGRRHEPGHMPATLVAAPPCRRRPRRHVPLVAWPDVPPPIGGLF
jgi:hypothetical protein